MRILALLALCIAAVAAVPGSTQRIVGGSPTTIDQYPTIANVLYSPDLITYYPYCGGTIINNRSVLTGAHCGGNAVFRSRLRLGSTWANSGGMVYNVNQIIIHPLYNPTNNDNGIAIFRSPTAFTFNDNVRAASIAGANYHLADNQLVWAAGWGTTLDSSVISEQLQHVEVVTINHNTCKNAFVFGGVAVSDNMLCTGWPDGGRSQCTGDAGGPVYHNGVVVGVSSFGFACGHVAFPYVNVRVSNYSSWIRSNA